MKTKITSYGAACKITGRNPKALPIVNSLPKKDQDYHVANHMLLVIAEGLKKEYSIQNNLKKDWTPDYNDGVHYETHFGVKAYSKRPSGFGFSYSGCAHWYAFTTVGSRFAFPTSEMAVYFGEKFEKLHLKTKL